MMCIAVSCDEDNLTSRDGLYRWCIFDEGKKSYCKTLQDITPECTYCVVVHGEQKVDDLFEREFVVLSAPEGYSVDDVAEAFMFRELYEVQC
jgi:hypothetical protein